MSRKGQHAWSVKADLYVLHFKGVFAHMRLSSCDILVKGNCLYKDSTLFSSLTHQE